MHKLFHLPFNRWPLACHVVAGVLLVCVALAAAMLGVARVDSLLTFREIELRTLKAKLDVLRQAPASAAAPGFDQTLPRSSRSDEVVRDISRFAHANGVALSSIGVEPRATSDTEYGRVGFNVAATADYRTTKAMMAELLGRYPSLGVQSLAMRPLASDQTRLDVRLALVMITRD